ncbi:MAG TPA: M48 family metalloprotease [Acidothermaceae bacterium]|nr:M48 family metalloprotease [Acidothermaceae bacterium]
MHTPNRFRRELRAAALLGLLGGLLLVVGQLLGGMTGLIIAGGVAVVVNVGMYFGSDRLALRAMRAKPLDERAYPSVVSAVRELAVAHEIPMPRLYLADTGLPNAFASGRNPEHAVVCVTTGLLARLDARELRGVLSHELSHVANRDLLVTSIAGTMATALVMIANMAQWSLLFGGGDDEDSPNIATMLAMLIVAPLAATALRMGLSRSREYAADQTGARRSGDPLALASALRVIADESTKVHEPMPQRAAGISALMISSPWRSGDRLERWMSSHPPTAERIDRLEQMAQRSLSSTR